MQIFNFQVVSTPTQVHYNAWTGELLTNQRRGIRGGPLEIV